MNKLLKIILIIFGSALLIAGTAATYINYDQTVNGWKAPIRASLISHCELNLHVDYETCAEWANDVIADFPDIVKACQGVGTYTDEGNCVHDDPRVWKIIFRQ